MGKDGWDNISVRDEVKSKLKLMYANDTNRPKKQTFGSYFEDLMLEIIEHNEKLQKHGAFLEFKQAIDNNVILKDNFLNKLVILTINTEKQKLHCEHHNNEDCIHVGFCFAVKKVYDVLVESGFKPPTA